LLLLRVRKLFDSRAAKLKEALSRPAPKHFDWLPFWVVFAGSVL
jgi:hypothetical protein